MIVSHIDASSFHTHELFFILNSFGIWECGYRKSIAIERADFVVHKNRRIAVVKIFCVFFSYFICCRKSKSIIHDLR